MPYFDWNKTDFKLGRPGVLYKTLAGKNMQLFYLKLAPGQTTNHIHPEEQIGYILAGEVELTIDTEKKLCKAGEAYLIPSNVRHGFKVLGDNFVEYIEIFSPPKPEHRNL